MLRRAMTLGVLCLLTGAVSDLARHNAEYRSIPDTHDGQQARKRHRRERQLAWLRVESLLATLGETALVEELRRLPMDRVVERLNSHLSSIAVRVEPGVSNAALDVAPQE